MARTFLIIDGSSLLYRAFYALPLLTTAGGQYTNAVYGFTSMLVKLLDEMKPAAVGVAFDKGKDVFRKKTYADYKAHRKATPPELAEQFATIRNVLQAMGIHTIEQDGYEADDLIGTLAGKAVAAGYEAVIITGDRDALQLIGPQTKVMLTKRGITDMQLMDEDALHDKYGIIAAQVVELKGLMGDTSDNIPGVPGVGEKTAVKLIEQFGTIDNLLDHLEQVSAPKLQEKLRLHADLARLSKDLATIVCDVPMEFSLADYEVTPCADDVRKLFLQLEFKSLLSRLGTLVPGVNDSSEQAAELPRAVVLEDTAAISDICAAIKAQARMVFYPVINGQVPWAVWQGLAVVADETAFYIPADTPGWTPVLKLLQDPAVAKITYDAKAAVNACRLVDRPLRGLVFDVVLAAYLLNPTAAEYPLPLLSQEYLGQMVACQEKEERNHPDYAVWAAAAIKKLQPELSARLAAAQLTSLYNDIELALIDVLSSMECNGITVDSAYLNDMSAEIAAKVAELLGEIYRLAGEEFNVNSTKQLGVILFDKLQLPVIKKTKTGYSTDAEVLEKLSGKHDIVNQLLEYRLLTKLKSTYLDGLGLLIQPDTGRIHTSFNQTVTATGRLSSSEPNLQNIPIRTDIGRRIRELFVPGVGYDYIMSADYSQIELRILAHMSQDTHLIDSFRQEQDVHTRTAAEVFGMPMAEVTPELRSRAKAVNFGIVYGISDYGLSRDLGISRKEAGQYIDSYFAKYQGVKKYIEQMVTEARQRGYVTTLFGRRRYLPDINSSNFNLRSFAERTAMNTPIQGTAADVIKKAMIDVHAALQEGHFQSRILLQVHDELLLEVTAEEKDRVAAIVKQCMENAVRMDVALTADVKTGKNWATAK